MKYIVSFCLCVLLAQTALTQKAVIKEISDISPVKKAKYVFPSIIIPSNKHAEDKINKKLQEEVLNLDSTGYKHSIFEEVWEQKEDEESDGRWVYTDFSYKIYSNSGHYLCLSIEFVGGKHAETQTKQYLFDTFTGEQVKLAQLLNTQGKEWLNKISVTGRNKLVRKGIVEQQDSLQQHRTRKDNEAIKDDERVLELYKDCLETDFLSDDEPFEYFYFYLQNNRMYITSPPCSDGWNILRMIGYDVNYAFSKQVNEIRQYLSPYGKKLLLAPAKSSYTK